MMKRKSNVFKKKLEEAELGWVHPYVPSSQVLAKHTGRDYQTFKRQAETHPENFKVNCLGSMCLELGITAEEIKVILALRENTKS
jgi:hypothetical protein